MKTTLAGYPQKMKSFHVYRREGEDLWATRCKSLAILSGIALASLAMLAPLARAEDEAKPRPAKPVPVKVDPSATPLRIAFISYANPQQVARDSQAVTAYLQPLLGVEVKSFVTSDYGSSIEAMRSEKADVAFVDPLAFMMAHEQIGAEPLLLEVYAHGKPTYTSCIWVRRDRGIKSLRDLKGGTIAFADQVDMSGHLLPREIFSSEGLVSGNKLDGGFFKQVYYAGGDEQAMRAVYNGFVDAAGVSQFAYLLLRPEERERVTVIARSIESPSHLVMVRKGMDAAIRQRMRQALLALDPTDAGDKKVLDGLYGVHGFVEAKRSDFAGVAAIAAKYGLVKDPALFEKD